MAALAAKRISYIQTVKKKGNTRGEELNVHFTPNQKVDGRWDKKTSQFYRKRITTNTKYIYGTVANITIKFKDLHI